MGGRRAIRILARSRFRRDRLRISRIGGGEEWNHGEHQEHKGNAQRTRFLRGVGVIGGSFILRFDLLSDKSSAGAADGVAFLGAPEQSARFRKGREDEAVARGV